MTLLTFLKLCIPYLSGVAFAAFIFFVFIRHHRGGVLLSGAFVLLLALIASLLACSASVAPSSRAAPLCAGLGVPSFAVTLQGRAVGSCACIAGHWWFVDPLGARTEGGADWCPLPRAQAELAEDRSL